MGDFGDYVENTIYGTRDNFVSQFGQIKDDKERKAKIYKFAQQKIDDYRAKAAENTDLNYSDVDKLDAMQKAISSED